MSEFLVITILATLNIGHATLVTDLDFSDFDGEFSIHNDSPAMGVHYNIAHPFLQVEKP